MYKVIFSMLTTLINYKPGINIKYLDIKYVPGFFVSDYKR